MNSPMPHTLTLTSKQILSLSSSSTSFYSVFINLVEESDEECEEELQLAIAASLEDCPPSSSRLAVLDSPLLPS